MVLPIDEATLTKYAAMVPVGGAIVEIGTHMGDTAIILAKAAPHAMVWTIDTGERYLWEQHDQGSLADYAQRVANRLALYGNIIFVLGSSHPKVGSSMAVWSGRLVDMLFIDGDHEHAAVMADLNRWAVQIPLRGRMLLHDYVDGDEGKVWSAANEYLAANPQWEMIEIVDTMLVCERHK
jgi:predicted O-methyltransferase YrrM